MQTIKELKVGVVGNGSWATALVKILCENLTTINWWVRNEYAKEYIELHEHNPNYLSSVEFDLNQLNITNDINEVASESDILILAVPSIYIKSCLAELTVDISEKIIVSAIKGIIPEELQIVGDFMADNYNVNPDNFGVISGPCHAEEVALERLSYLTMASQNKEHANLLADLFNCHYISTTTSKDMIGTEYAAVLKNIYAIAAGIAHGMGYGDNFHAVLMSNSIREMNRLVKTVSPTKRNICDSAYLGDLLVTGYSYFSRNRMLGNMIGKGYTVKSALLEMTMIAEGYYATEAIYKMKDRYDVKIPIISAVHKVLYRDKNPKKVFEELTKKLS